MNTKNSIIFAILIASFFTSCNTATPEKTKSPLADTTVKTVVAKYNLPVIPLPTIDGGAEDDAEVNNFKYPPTLPLNDIDGLNDQLSAYGAAYKVWAGPKGWTGRSNVGADGNTLVYLFPKGGDSLAGPYVYYYQIPVCANCILWAAAEYFPEAMDEYNADSEQNHADSIRVPEGMQIKRISPELVTYTLPAKNGLQIHGVAYYSTSSGDPYFTEAKFVLPQEQSAISGFLEKTFIAGITDTSGH